MRTRRSADETRAHVLAVAHELFYWQGIRAIGVDRIAAEAEIAPTTLYRLFASKDDLIAAYVERAHEAYREWFRTALDRGGDDPANACGRCSTSSTRCSSRRSAGAARS